MWKPVPGSAVALIEEHFGNRVRELRQGRDLSQEALALACELDRTYIGSVERGERNISLINIHKIALGLGVPPEKLLIGSPKVRIEELKVPGLISAKGRPWTRPGPRKKS